MVCTLQGSCDILPSVKKLKPVKVQVHLLEVIPAQQLQGIPTTQIAARVHALMAADLGPEQVLK